MSITLPNMSLEVPSVGDVSAVYASAVSTSLNNIDDHDHTTGKGLQIPTAGIANLAVTTAKIANNNVTRAKLEALGQQVSADSGTFTSTSVTFVDVTNLTVTITTSGRPVFVGLIYGGAGSAYVGGRYGAGAGTSVVFLQILRDVTAVFNTLIGTDANAQPSNLVAYAPAAFSQIDVVAAGTYTYKVQVAAISDAQAEVQNCKLIAYEL